MPKNKSIQTLKGAVLTSDYYVSSGTIIIVYNNTERAVYTHIAFFELVFEGATLFLNFSTEDKETHFNHRISLENVHNINGVPINQSF